MNDKDTRNLRHFTTPFRMGNIIMGAMALCFLPMFLALIVFSAARLLEAFLGAK